MSSYHSDNDNVYLTVNISANNLNNNFPVIYNSNLSYPLIENLSEYMVSVDSATIPTDNLPLFWPLIQNYPNTNNNLTQYSFTMEYLGIFSDEIFATFISQNPQVPFIPLSSTKISADFNSSYYDVFTVGPILDMLNNTLNDAFVNLSGKVVLPVNSLPPFFTFDYDNDKFELNGQLSYYDQYTLLNPINIYSNYFTFTITDKIDFTYLASNPSNLRFLYNIKSNNENVYYKEPSFPPPPPTSDDYYIRMVQDISTIGNLTPVKSICITSQSLPIKQDYLPQSKSSLNVNNSLIGEEVIVSEFEPVLRFSPTVIGQEYQYRPEYRKSKEMKSKLSLQRIDIVVNWRDILGILHPVYSNINKVTTVRLVFTKKYINS